VLFRFLPWIIQAPEAHIRIWLSLPGLEMHFGDFRRVFLKFINQFLPDLHHSFFPAGIRISPSFSTSRGDKILSRGDKILPQQRHVVIKLHLAQRHQVMTYL
jgi:hypothetical protein